MLAVLVVVVVLVVVLVFVRVLVVVLVFVVVLIVVLVLVLVFVCLHYFRLFAIMYSVLSCPAAFWTLVCASQNGSPKMDHNIGTKRTTPTVGVVRFGAKF